MYQKIELPNGGKIELVDRMGQDLTVVNAARVSMHKWKTAMDKSDVKLINYLANNNHWTPFSHGMIQLRLKMPIFVARQWFKHTVGFSRNEVSRRYVKEEPEFYLMGEWREAPTGSVKQGSGGALPEEVQTEANYLAQYVHKVTGDVYRRMTENLRICPEQARSLLPQDMQTELIETSSLYGYARLCNLRLDSHAQREIRDYAQAVSDLIEPLFPVSWEALTAKELPETPSLPDNVTSVIEWVKRKAESGDVEAQEIIKILEAA